MLRFLVIPIRKQSLFSLAHLPLHVHQEVTSNSPNYEQKPLHGSY